MLGACQKQSFAAQGVPGNHGGGRPKRNERWDELDACLEWVNCAVPERSLGDDVLQ